MAEPSPRPRTPPGDTPRGTGGLQPAGCAEFPAGSTKLVRRVSSSPSDRANNPEELLDLVDEHDHVIGTVRKAATERDPSLLHREIAILIHRGGELLWQLRSSAKTVMALTWDISCAGHVGAGDRPERAAHRELREELGFDVELVLLERRLVRATSETYFASVFAGAAGEGIEPVIDRDEVAAVEWCDEVGYRSWRANGRILSPLACELAEAFWAGRWSLRP
jgi:isopentenyldiphosphate isomerase